MDKAAIRAKAEDVLVRVYQIQDEKDDISVEVEQSQGIIEAALTQAYEQGLKDGIWKYAWMKDGVYYVGTTGSTYKEAIRRIEDKP